MQMAPMTAAITATAIHSSAREATPAADGTAVASRAELWMAVAVIAAVIGAICMRVVFYELGASVFMLY